MTGTSGTTAATAARTPSGGTQGAAWPLHLTPGVARRRAGRWLVAFGVTGLALLVLAAVLVVGALGALGQAAASLEDQRVRLVALIEPTAQALDRSATTAENAGTSLEASGRAARDAAAMTAELATAMDSMATAAQIDVFGLQPFAGLADDLASVASRSRTLATNLETTAAALDANVLDSQATAADLRTLVVELEAMRSQLGTTQTGGDPAAGGGSEGMIALARIVLLGLLAWLAVPALLAIRIGWGWRRG